jgi:hypothetical protein
MLIKFYYQNGASQFIDNLNAMLIKVDDTKHKNISKITKLKLLEILKQDGVNINEIEQIRFFDKQNDGWRLFSENTCIDLRLYTDEIKILIKKVEESKSTLPTYGDLLIDHLQEINERIINQERRLREMENLLKTPQIYNGGGNFHHNIGSYERPRLYSPNNNQSYNYNQNNFTYPQLTEESHLDFAFIYSNPLIKIITPTPQQNFQSDLNKDDPNFTQILSLNEPVDYEKEILNLVDCFKNTNKKISARFEIANFDNLQEVLRKRPKILHISCQGAYEYEENLYLQNDLLQDSRQDLEDYRNKDYKDSNFYLYFEDNIGRLDKFNTTKLSKLLNSLTNQNDNNEIQNCGLKLIIISSSHSQEIAEILINTTNIPFIISVHSDTSMFDPLSLKFYKIFYECLFEGKSIEFSFDIAKKIVFAQYDYKNSKIIHCCCFHKHKIDCPWKKYNMTQQNEQNEKSHLFHLKQCKCAYPESHVHNINCLWVKNFREKLNIEYVHLYNDNSKLIKVCCCSPEILHDESNKFSLYKNKNSDNKILRREENIHSDNILFRNLPYGSLEIKNKYFSLNIKFSVDMKTSIIGRNLELYEVIKIFNKNSLSNFSSESNHRLLTITGNPGLGKRSFAKLSGIYLYERKFFDGVYFLEIKNFNETDLVSLICISLDIDIQVTSIYQLFKFIDSKILLIFRITKNNNLEEFRKFIDTVLRNTKFIKFIIVCVHPMLSDFESVIELKNLNSFYSAKLLYILAGDYLPMNLRNDLNLLEKHELVKISHGIPNKIQQIAALLQEGIKLEILIQKIKKENLINSSNGSENSLSDELFDVMIKNVINSNTYTEEQIHEIIFTLMLSPNGLIQRDIISIYENKSQLYSSALNLLEYFINNGQNIFIIKKEIKDLSKDLYIISGDFCQSVEKYSNIKIDIFMQERVFVRLLKFYANLTRNILINIYQSSNLESFTEFSAAQNYGMWLTLNKNSFSRIMNYQYEKIYNPLKHFQHIEGNLMCLLKLENLNKFVHAENSFNDKNNNTKSNENYFTLIESIEQLSITLPSILKHSNRLPDCMIMIKTFSNILEHFNLLLAKGRLMIFSNSVYPLICSNSQTCSENNDSQLLDPMNLFEYYREGMAESYLCRAVIQYTIYESKIKNSTSKMVNHFKYYKERLIEVNRELEKSLQIYREKILHVNDGDVLIGYGRVCYIISDYNIRNKDYDMNKYLPLLKEALNIFEKNNRYIYFIKSMLNISKLYVGNKFLLEGKDFAEQALKYSIKFKYKILEGEIKDLLSDIYDSIRVQSNNVFVFMRAYQLVYSVDLTCQTENFVKKPSIAEIENEYKNLRRLSSTEAGFNSRKVIEEEVQPLVSYASKFRQKMNEVLLKANREIFVKYDVLNKDFFIDVIKKGGRILHLSSDFFIQGNSLFLEGEYGETLELTSEEISKLLRESKSLYDLVILAIPQSNDLAKVFIESGVPFVICFNFSDKILQSTGIYTDQNYQIANNSSTSIDGKLLHVPFMNLINEFSVYLCARLVQGDTLLEAFNFARREFINIFKSQILRNYLDQNDKGDQRDELSKIDYEGFNEENNFYFGPSLLSSSNNTSSTNLNVKFYKKDSKGVEEKISNEGRSSNISNKSIHSNNSLLSEGKLMELSKLRARIVNVDKRNSVMIGRKKETYFAIKNFTFNEGKNLNIYGENLLGRTLLSKEICYYLSVRQKFRDGIFYLDISEITSIEALRDLFDKYQINSAIEQNKKYYSTGHISKTQPYSQDDKRILVVLDNCDKIIKHCENQFFLFIFSINKERGERKNSITNSSRTILFLLISHKKIINANFLHSEYLHLYPLDRKESITLFLCYCQREINLNEIDSDEQVGTGRNSYLNSNLNNPSNVNNVNNLNSNFSLFEHLGHSKRLKACRGIPAFIKQLASLANECNLDRIPYEAFIPKKMLNSLLAKEGFVEYKSFYTKLRSESFQKKRLTNIEKKNKFSGNKKENLGINFSNNDEGKIYEKINNSITPVIDENNPLPIQHDEFEYENDYKISRTKNYMKKNSKKKKISNTKIQKVAIFDSKKEIEQMMNRRDRDDGLSIASISISSSSSSSDSESSEGTVSEYEIEVCSFECRDHINYKLAHSFQNKPQNYKMDTKNSNFYKSIKSNKENKKLSSSNKLEDEREMVFEQVEMSDCSLEEGEGGLNIGKNFYKILQ